MPAYVRIFGWRLSYNAVGTTPCIVDNIEVKVFINLVV